jgi:hypothetical protein
MNLSRAALAALLLSSLVRAQNKPVPNQTPAPAIGAPVSQTLVLTNPSGACANPNATTYNYATGDLYGCVAGAWKPLGGSSSQPTYVATPNASTGAATCDFTAINGATPACLLANSTNTGQQSNNVQPTLTNLPAAASAANPVTLHFYIDEWAISAITWPASTAPHVYCGGGDNWVDCNSLGFSFRWSGNSPQRQGAGTGHVLWHFTGVYNGTDVYLQGDSGFYQTVDAAHVNANIIGVTEQTGSGPGALNLNFGAVMSLNQNSIIRTNTASNQDMAGQLTLAGGTASYTFGQTYTSAPVCVATDTTAANAVKIAVTATALTITGTGTDVIDYLCIGRN